MSNTENKIKLYNKFIEPKFKNKNNNILILDSYNNLIIEWLFYTFCYSPDSKIYCLNNWNMFVNKINFLDINIEIIEEKLYIMLNKLNKYNDQIKIYDENNKQNKIFKLYKENIFFNIIYINAAIDSINLFINIIFIFGLLNERGIIILDNYNLYNNTDNDHAAGIALESFLHLYGDQINILYYKTQIIIEKKKYMSDLFKNISKINTGGSLYKLDAVNNDELIYNFTLSDSLKSFEKQYGFDEEDIKIFYKLYNIDSQKYIKYEFNSLLVWDYDFNIIYKSLTNKILNDSIKYNYDPYYKLKILYSLTIHNTDNMLYDIICKINNNNLFISDTGTLSLSSMCYYTRPDEYNNNIEKYLIKKFDVIKSKYYRIDNESRSNSEYISSINSVSEICKITKKINNKIDIIFMSSPSIKKPLTEKYDYEKNYTTLFYYNILFSLMNQSINGCSVIEFFSPLCKISTQLLWIIKKYYKNIYFFCNNYTNIIKTGYIIIATNFIGIPDLELEKIKKIGINIYESTEIHNEVETNEFVYSILKIDDSNIPYKNFCDLITQYNLKKIKIIINYNKLLYEVINYLENNNNSKKLKIKLKNLIFTIQLKNIYMWIENNKVI